MAVVAKEKVTAMATGNSPPPPSRDLAATALVLGAKAAAELIVDDADGSNSGVAIVGSASLAAGVG